MVGTFADVVVADAVIKRIPGFDVDTAVEAVRKDSFEPPPPHAGGAAGKDGLRVYTEKGYIPINGDGGGEAVSRTLDFAFADRAVAEALERLAVDAAFVKGDRHQQERMQKEAAELKARAQKALQSSFDPSYGLMVRTCADSGFDCVLCMHLYTSVCVVSCSLCCYVLCRCRRTTSAIDRAASTRWPGATVSRRATPGTTRFLPGRWTPS
jgi:hypothetical protein